jgi:hypothetical protein
MTKEALTLALKVYEMHIVAREKLCNGAADDYFDANPTHDNDVDRKLFEQGFARGFDSAAELASSGAYDVFRCSPVYRDPPQRTWVGLTDREKSNLWLESRTAIPRFHTYATLVEAKLKEKNGA